MDPTIRLPAGVPESLRAQAAGTAVAAEKDTNHIAPSIGSDDDGAFLVLPERLVTLGQSLGPAAVPHTRRRN